MTTTKRYLSQGHSFLGIVSRLWNLALREKDKITGCFGAFVDARIQGLLPNRVLTELRLPLLFLLQLMELIDLSMAFREDAFL